MADTPDRSAEFLKALQKGKVVAVGNKGTGEVDITGLADGTVVKDGDYQVVFDTDNTKTLSSVASDPVDAPGATVPTTPTTPTTPPSQG